MQHKNVFPVVTFTVWSVTGEMELQSSNARQRKKSQAIKKDCVGVTEIWNDCIGDKSDHETQFVTQWMTVQTSYVLM